MTKQFIEIKDFSFCYFEQEQPTLKNINLTINKGEIVLILGQSGCGKSTLIHALNGLIPEAYKGEISGDILINGQSILKRSIFERSKMLGTILQDSDHQFVALTIEKDIAFALENQNLPESEIENRITPILEKLNLVSLKHSQPQNLSGGQKQRCALGGVMVCDVDTYLFDEPLANLDPLTGLKTMQIIEQLKQEDKTIIIVEHRLEDVMHINIDRVVLMDDGKIIYNGDLNSLLKSSLLVQSGIREPLYLSAMKLHDIDINMFDNITKIPETFSQSNKIKVAEQLKAFSFNNSSKSKNKILEIKNLCFEYNKNSNVLNNVNLDIYAGDMISVVGKNGAGKSTLAKIMSGYLKPKSGEVLLNSQSMQKMSLAEIGQHVGYILQSPNQMLSQTMIYDEVALGLRVRQIDESVVKQQVEKALKICGLLEFKDWPISALSYGQKKRVSIAAILVLEPEILILDEPTAGQDLFHYQEIMNFLLELNNNGQTIVMISHDMHLIFEYSNRCLVVGNKTIVADEDVHLVLNNSQLCLNNNLLPTSLYEMAFKLEISDPIKFMHYYIQHQREDKYV